MARDRQDSDAGAGARDAGGAMGETAPPLHLTLWPHRSMRRHNLRWVMMGAGGGMMIPVVPLIGSKAIYVIGPFVLAYLGLLYGMMALTYRSGRVRETVSLWADRLRVERVDPDGTVKIWEANPCWVRLELLQTRRVEDYLVLSSAGRSIELGAFLTPQERRDLAERLQLGLADAKSGRLGQNA
ncbi:MAG: DUF2244 domain-containing protein [Pseudomonadota bacterium]